MRRCEDTCASRKSTLLNHHDDEEQTVKAPVSAPRLTMTNESPTFPIADLSCATFALSMTLKYAPGITLGLTPCFRHNSCSLHHTYMRACVWMTITGCFSPALSCSSFWLEYMRLNGRYTAFYPPTMNLISLVYFEHVLGAVNVEMNSAQTEVCVHLYLHASSLLTNIFPPNTNKHFIFCVLNDSFCVIIL